ncbi:MAG: membrane protein insertion efficiency factor YidD, partial [Myxococcota bacterium]
MIRALVIQLLLLPLRFYKAVISPFLPPMCRFHPSCSVYAMGAVAVHGPFKGTWLAFRRVTRCHPFNPGGLDPVPPRDGQSAEALLQSAEPEIAQRLSAPPHPSLAVILGPAPSVA